MSHTIATDPAGAATVFSAALRGLIERTAGGLCAALVASDGIIVHREGEGAPDLDLGTVTAHLTDLLRRSTSIGRECGFGPTAEIIQKTPAVTLVMRAVTPEYCLMLFIQRDAAVGPARRELVRAADALRGELA